MIVSVRNVPYTIVNGGDGFPGLYTRTKDHDDGTKYISSPETLLIMSRWGMAGHGVPRNHSQPIPFTKKVQVQVVQCACVMWISVGLMIRIQ
jgi:hypothetical protein